MWELQALRSSRCTQSGVCGVISSVLKSFRDAHGLCQQAAACTQALC